MKRLIPILYFTFVLIGLSVAAQAETTYRFPQPEFESGYELPETSTPAPPILDYVYIDIAVLLITLALGTYLVVQRRSRRDVFVLMLFSLFYFGFWRHAAAYLIRSIQNVALALADPQYAIPLFVIACFVLPLLTAIFFGRIFCGAVCPFGAIQDFVLLRPVKLPGWLCAALGIPAYIFLGLAVAMAATGTGFIIGRFNPFMGVFRFGTSFGLFVFAGITLLTSVFVGRPFCRFLCPYGVVLSWFSYFSRYHMKLTQRCIKCGKCHTACPFNAVLKPTDSTDYGERWSASRRSLMIGAVLSPLLVGIAVWIGGELHVPLSRLHDKVRLAERIQLEEKGMVEGTTLESEAFRQSGTPQKSLFREATEIKEKWRIAGWGLGGFLGLIFVVKLLFLCFWPYRERYEIDTAYCISCARCVEVCPTRNQTHSE